MPKASTKTKAVARIEGAAQLATQTKVLAAKVNQVLVLSTREDEAMAMSLLRDVAEVSKKLEAARTERKAPLIAEGKAIDREAKELAAPLDQLTVHLKALLRAYVLRCQAEAAKIEARIQEEAVKDAKGLLTMAAEPIDMAMMPALPKSEANTRRKLVVTITDEKQLPREYLVPDHTKIRHAAEAGILIPGVTVTDDVVIVAR